MTGLAFHRVGVMTYEVSHDDVLVGLLWRTRRGDWSASLPDGSVVINEFRGSRATAAANLTRRYKEAEA